MLTAMLLDSLQRAIAPETILYDPAVMPAVPPVPELPVDVLVWGSVVAEQVWVAAFVPPGT